MAVEAMLLEDRANIGLKVQRIARLRQYALEWTGQYVRTGERQNRYQKQRSNRKHIDSKVGGDQGRDRQGS